MIGYLILGCVILTAITCIVVYVTGWKQGKEKVASEYTKATRKNNLTYIKYHAK